MRMRVQTDYEVRRMEELTDGRMVVALNGCDNHLHTKILPPSDLSFIKFHIHTDHKIPGLLLQVPG